MSTEIVCGSDENESEEDGVYGTWEEAIAAAAAASRAEGEDGRVIVHRPSCAYDAADDDGCTCTPEVIVVPAGGPS